VGSSIVVRGILRLGGNRAGCLPRRVATAIYIGSGNGFDHTIRINNVSIGESLGTIVLPQIIVGGFQADEGDAPLPTVVFNVVENHVYGRVWLFRTTYQPYMEFRYCSFVHGYILLYTPDTERNHLLPLHVDQPFRHRCQCATDIVWGNQRTTHTKRGVRYSGDDTAIFGGEELAVDVNRIDIRDFCHLLGAADHCIQKHRRPTDRSCADVGVLLVALPLLVRGTESRSKRALQLRHTRRRDTRVAPVVRHRS